MKRFLKVCAGCMAALFAVAILLVVAGGAYLATCDDDELEPLAVWLVRVATGHEVAIDGAFSLHLSWHPTLTVTDFSITPGAGNDAFFQAPQVGRFEMMLDLPVLRQGVIHVERLRLEGATVALRETQRPRGGVARAHRTWPGALLVSDVELTDSRVVYRGKQAPAPTTLELDSLTLKSDPAGEMLEVAGKGTVNGYPATVSGMLGSAQEFLQPAGPYPVRLRAELHGAGILLAGTVDQPTTGSGLALEISAEAKEIADLLRLVRRDWPATGALKANAKLAGDFGSVRLEEFSVAIAGTEGSKWLCTGTVADLNRRSGVDLQVEVQVLNTSRFKALYSVDIPNLDRVSLQGRLLDSGGVLGVQDLKIVVEDGDLTARVQGTVGGLHLRGPLPFERAELTVSARTADLSTWSALTGHKLPPFGPVSFETKMQGASGELAFTDLDLRVGPSEEAQVRVSGRVKTLRWAPHIAAIGVDLRIDGEADDASRLLVWRPADLPGDVSLDRRLLVSGRVTDADGSLKLEGAHLTMGTEDTGMVLISGEIEDLENLGGASLSVQVHLPNLTALSPFLTQIAPLQRNLASIGPVNGTLKIRDKAGVFGAQDIDFRFGSRPDAWLRVAGRVGNLVARKDLDLTVDLSANNLTDLGFLLGRDLPSMGPVEVAGRLAQGSEGIGLEDLSVQVGSSGDDSIHATGQVENLATLAGLQLDLEVSLIDLALVEALAGRALPKAGPVTGTLKIVSENWTVSAREIDVHVGSRNGVWVDLEGRVGDLRTFHQVEISAHAGTAALPLLEPLAGRKLPDIGPVEATAKLADQDGTLGVEAFRLASGVADRFKLELTGGIDDIRALDAAEFDLRLQANDLSGLAALGDTPLPAGRPIELVAHFKGSKQQGRLDMVEWTIGRTKFQGEASYTMEGDKPDIAAKLTSPLVYTADLYLAAPELVPSTASEHQTTPRETQQTERQPPRREWLFSDAPLPLHWLHAANLDFTLAVDVLDAGPVQFTAIKSDLNLRDGRLVAHLLESQSQGGDLKGSLDIDAGGEIASLATTLQVTGWEPGALQAQYMDEPYVEGEMDGKLDLRSRGHSMREIMASLDGEISIIMGGGTLRGIAIDLLAANLFRQLLTSEDPRAIPINCSVEHLKIANGLATVETILVDTDISTIRGAGTIDLRRERIDILLKPEPKNPRLATIKTPVSIRGDLADPTVTVESTGSFVKKLAQAVGLGLINPFAAVIPFVSIGSLEQHPCAKFLKPVDGVPAPQTPQQ